MAGVFLKSPLVLRIQHMLPGNTSGTNSQGEFMRQYVNSNAMSHSNIWLMRSHNTCILFYSFSNTPTFIASLTFPSIPHSDILCHVVPHAIFWEKTWQLQGQQNSPFLGHWTTLLMPPDAMGAISWTHHQVRSWTPGLSKVMGLN